jgi:hypothetical protein
LGSFCPDSSSYRVKTLRTLETFLFGGPRALALSGKCSGGEGGY